MEDDLVEHRARKATTQPSAIAVIQREQLSLLALDNLRTYNAFYAGTPGYKQSRPVKPRNQKCD